jgi:hypothetical protein
MIAASTGKAAALASSCELCGSAGVADGDCACSIMPVTSTPRLITTASAITSRRLATAPCKLSAYALLPQRFARRRQRLGELVGLQSIAERARHEPVHDDRVASPRPHEQRSAYRPPDRLIQRLAFVHARRTAHAGEHITIDALAGQRRHPHDTRRVRPSTSSS